MLSLNLFAPMKRFGFFRAYRLALAVSFLAAFAFPQAPRFSRIDPPNWWIGLPNPMLLISGDGLENATVSSASDRVKVLRVQNEATGHYVFAWLDTSHAHASAVNLVVRTTHGVVTVPFPLSTRTSPSQGFQGFNQDDVIYLIMPDRFADGDPGNDRPAGSKGTYDGAQPKAYHGGDLRGIREHLDYLHDLGVNTLWLTPIWKNTNSDYHGYHVVDFYGTDDHLGTLQEYEGLAADAHKLGMKIMIDYVVNHTGPEHPWVNQPPSPTWFHGTPENHLDAVTSFSSLIDPHALPIARRGTIEGWFVNKLPDLNTDDPLLSQYLLDNAIWWTESAHLDAFRLDTFPYSLRKFWSEWLPQLYRVYPSVNTLGEVSDPEVTTTSFFDGGHAQFDGIDSHVSTIFDYPLYYALRDVILHGKPMQNIINVLEHDSLYAHPETLVTFLGNHDTSRFAGEADSSPEKLKAALALLFTLRGIPQIYYGDEIGMPGDNDPDNRRDFPGGFAGDSHNAFSAAGRTASEQEIFSHVQELVKLRHAHPALRRGRQWHISWDDSYYAFIRESAEEKLLIVFNNANASRKIKLNVAGTPLENAHELQLLFGAGEAEIQARSDLLSLPALSVSVYQIR